MIIQFPDGYSIDTSTGVYPFLNRPVTLVSFIDQIGSLSAYGFAGQSEAEMVQMYQLIINGLKAKLDFLQLLSSAPIPTGGNATGKDMFPNNSATTPTVVASQTFCYLIIGDPGIGYWPSLMGQGTTAAIPACFRPQCTVTIGGQMVTQLEYISALALKFYLPALPTGTYDLVYTDTRGSVTKAASFQYP